MITIVALSPLVGHPKTELIPRVEYDPSGRVVVTSGDDGLRFWNAADGAAIRHVPGRFADVLVDADGETVLAGTKDHALAFDVRTGREVGRWATGWDWVEGLATDPQERWVVILDDSDTHVLRYDRATGARTDVPEALRDGRGPLTFSPSGVLYFKDARDRLVAWDAATGETWTDGRNGFVARMDWSGGSTGWMATAVWDWPSHQPLPWWQGWVRVTGPDGQAVQLDHTGYDVAIGPYGRIVATTLFEKVHIIEVATGTELATLDAGGSVSMVDISADYQLAATTSAGPVLRWQLTLPGSPSPR